MEALWVLVTAAFEVWLVPHTAIVMPSLRSVAVTEVSRLRLSCSFKVPQSLQKSMIVCESYTAFANLQGQCAAVCLHALFAYKFIFLITHGCYLQRIQVCRCNVEGLFGSVYGPGQNLARSCAGRQPASLLVPLPKPL